MKNALIGTWKLLSCEHKLADGSVVLPYGPSPVGRLVYTADGFMIVTLMSSGRAKFASPGLFDGTKTELAAAANSFIAYSGRYDMLDGKVVHHVDVSLFPNWVGSRQVRAVHLNGKRLTLSTRSFPVDGVLQTAHLTWERV